MKRLGAEMSEWRLLAAIYVLCLVWFVVGVLSGMLLR